MKKLTLTAVAIASVSLFATPAMAQSSYGGSTSGSYGNKSSSVDKASRQAAKAEKKRMEALAMKEKEAARLDAIEKKL